MVVESVDTEFEFFKDLVLVEGKGRQAQAKHAQVTGAGFQGQAGIAISPAGEAVVIGSGAIAALGIGGTFKAVAIAGSKEVFEGNL